MVKYNVGDTIEYDSLDGLRTIVVGSKEDDIKNGMPRFDGECITPGQPRWVWGYDAFVVRGGETGQVKV